VIIGDELYVLPNSIDDNEHQFDELIILNLGKKNFKQKKFRYNAILILATTINYYNDIHINILLQ